MLGKTHMLAGAVAGYLVSPDWKGIVAGAIVGLLPDIDQPGSLLGRTLYPVSYIISRKFRHRTFTHSLLFAFIVYAVCASLDPQLGIIAAAGLASHLLGDMITGRLLLLWPSRKWIGIRIPRTLYTVMDRGIFFMLIAFSVWYAVSNLLSRI
ncbi:metal-dependent hydrolase [Aneurinibacillus sp. Ricciae_BoGa-3]|uniref:metal-dependent hydrolase n=1 Tax=Aneurinibacillus sp. Ricciae_BoGa-3 TaxID=3022697 RepID=UPI0023413862|nr:metal-dependent hydrolase [Aneurinibacillus sp. Ricciae_BoGa-3]WCK55297.1 metal-dependent hydrolase [Aneurinibacillus sp. Ricciae_BoGa-3]